MLKIILLLTILALASASFEADWAIFKVKYQRFYNEKEDLYRREIYAATMKKVKAHNELYSQGLSSYYMGENQFSDWTEEELTLPIRSSHVKVNYSNKSRKIPQSSIDVSRLPRNVDWREKGYVTPVQDEGQCFVGSPIFGALAALEGQHFKAKKELVQLSVSQVIDCSNIADCNLASTNDVYDYIIDAGSESTKDYPFVDHTQNCTYRKKNVVTTMNGYRNIKSGDEIALQQATAEIGPSSAWILALPSFRNYRGGIYRDTTCYGSVLSIVVTVVGYGRDKGNDFWLVKNSWGTTWGDKGYAKMTRNENNQCNIATEAVYPLV